MSDLKIKCEVYSRCVGYFRPVQEWNVGKKEEFNERAEISQENIKKFITKALLLFIILLPVSSIAQESKRIPALKDYNGHYFIAGNQEDQVKVMTSFKYAVLYPHSIGLYVAYSQVMMWDLYKKSSPFKNIDYNPECFWEHKFEYIGLRLSPAEHKSNGRDGDESRSLNRTYGTVFYNYGKNLNFGGSTKVFHYYNYSSKNKDIQDYTGNFTQELFLQVRTKGKYIEQEKLYYRFGLGNSTSFKKGWHEIGARVRIVTTRVQMFLFAQYYYGYMESLLDYNIKEKRFRIGIQLF